MQQIFQDNAFNENVVLVQSDNLTLATGVVSGSITLEYKRESDSSWTGLSGLPLQGFTWTEIGGGMYRVEWNASFSNELGIFSTRVVDPNVTGWLPVFEETQIVAAPFIVQVGASYDGTTLGLSFGLEREGNAITNPVSGAYTLYNQTGTAIASGNNLSSDAQGVFRFSKSLTLTDDTVPYIHAQVKGSSGSAVVTRQFLPVVG